MILYFLILSLLLVSCSKTKSVPDPSAELTFGTLTFDTYIKFIAFKSQDTIESSQLDTIKFMGIKISEMHLDSSYFLTASGLTLNLLSHRRRPSHQQPVPRPWKHRNGNGTASSIPRSGLSGHNS